MTASLEEIAQAGNYSMDDVEEALAMVQELDPPGVARATCTSADDALRTLTMLKVSGSRRIRWRGRSFSEHLKSAAEQPAQGNCAGGEPPDGTGEARGGCDQEARSEAGAALQQDGAAAGRAGRAICAKSDGEWQAIHERRRRAATSAKPDLSPAAGARRGGSRCPELREGAFHRGNPVDEKYRAAQAHDRAGLPVDFAAAAGFPGLRRRTI